MEASSCVGVSHDSSVENGIYEDVSKEQVSNLHSSSASPQAPFPAFMGELMLLFNV